MINSIEGKAVRNDTMVLVAENTTSQFVHKSYSLILVCNFKL